MTEKRYELISFHFHELCGVLYDNLKEERIQLSIYEMVELLNNASQKEYDLKKLRNNLNELFDEMMENE